MHFMIRFAWLLFMSGLFFSSQVLAQDDDLLSLIEVEEEDSGQDYVKAGFKTTRVINSHSFENTAGGVLDMKISHRFGTLNSGAYNLWGLDNATIRLGLDYGITDRLMVGFGRSSVGKTYDGFIKYKFLWQTADGKMPVSAALVSTMAIETLRWADPDRRNFFTSRLFYSHQLIVGRKFSDNFSLQLMPTIVHRNIVPTAQDTHDVLAFGIAGRQKLTKRMAINVEYYYVLPEQLNEMFRNSLSIGFDIETGGHVFQLHFTNSTAMIEKGYITETTGNWFDGDIHFGFNISRVFTIANKR